MTLKRSLMVYDNSGGILPRVRPSKSCTDLQHRTQKVAGYNNEQLTHLNLETAGYTSRPIKGERQITPCNSNLQSSFLLKKLLERLDDATISAQKPRRLHLLRNTRGFRRYNQLAQLVADSLQSCIAIDSLFRRRHTDLEIALKDAYDAVDKLRVAESMFYTESDKIIKCEEKAQELKFLKENIQNCIKNTVALVREQLPRSAPDSKIYEEVTSILKEHWSSHNEYRMVLSSLQALFNTTGNPELSYEEQHVDSEAMFACVKDTCNLINNYFAANAFKQLFDAGTTLELLDSIYNGRLKPIESSLVRAIQRDQVILGFLFKMTFEVKSTKNHLVFRTAQMKQKQSNRSRDVFEEEQALLEFIDVGRKYDNNIATSSKDEANKVSDHAVHLGPRVSRSTVVEHENPVWAQSWAGSPTKILKARRPLHC